MAIQSLFGPSPEEILLARQREQQQQTMLRNQQIAQQGQQFGVFAPLYQAGLRFGDVASQAAMQGLFPQQMDPQLQKATAVQSVLSKYADQDQSNPEVLTKIGKELMPVAPDAGLNALSLAEKFKKETKRTVVAPGASVIDERGNVIFTAPEADKDKTPQTEAERAKLLSLYQKYPNTTEGRAQAANEFVEWKSSFKEREAKAGAQKLDLGGVLTEAFAKKEGAEKAAAWAKAGEAYNLTVPLLRELDTANAAAQNAFFGFGAKGKVGLSKALGALGIPISERASDSEFLDAISSKLVQRIAKNFPGSQAIKELEQLIKSKPNLEQESRTFMRLLNNVTLEFKASALAYEKLAELPESERYKKDINVFTGQIYRKLGKYEDITSKIRNKTASVEEAQEALAIKRELGL